MWTHRANFGCSTTLPTDQRTVDEYSAPVFGKGLREYKSITFRPDTYSFREIDSEMARKECVVTNKHEADARCLQWYARANPLKQ